LPKEQTTRYNRLGAVVQQILTDRVGTTATDTFRYDQSGNRINLHDRGAPGVWTGLTYPPASNRIAAKFDSVLEGADTLKPNRHFLYDSTGARWVEYTILAPADTFAMQIYQYDAAGRLMGSAQGSSTHPVVFLTQANSCMYDADGRAVQPCGAGAVTLFGDNVIHDPNGNWFYIHAPGIDEPLLAIKCNTGDNSVQARLDMVSNGQGQLFAVADSAGRLNSAYALQVPGSNGGPWGSGTTTRAQTFNPRRWATPGQADTISTFRTRQYDPATGVWLQEDPIGLAGGVNLYQYNGNDPNSFGDPFGTCPPRDDSPCTLGDVLTGTVSAGFQAGVSVSTGIVGAYAQGSVGGVASIELSTKYPAELTVSSGSPKVEFGGELLGRRGGARLDLAKAPELTGSLRAGSQELGAEHHERSGGSTTKIGVAVGLGFDVTINWAAVREIAGRAARQVRSLVGGLVP
jgi:RHS repeat-associated protein